MNHYYISKRNFQLPIGLLDPQGNIHREGTIRATNGLDELLVQNDRRTRENPTYGIFIFLSKTILKLGNLETIDVERLEGLFTKDLKYLIDVYNSLNPQIGALSLAGKI